MKTIRGLRFVIGIKDPIHGIILLTKREYELTTSHYFDRLRYIKKSGLANLVYPSHNSTRYEHSIGTMQIAYNIARNAIESYLRRHSEKWREEWGEEYSLNQIYQLIRFAALLHDLGHGPFSHTSERVLETVMERYYPNEFNEAKKLSFSSIHEYYSFKLIVTESSIRDVISDSGIEPIDVASLLSKRYPEEINLSLRQEIWGILKDMIDSQVDADRLDNLLRDSYGMGVPYGIVDTDNLIKNIYITELGEGKLILVTHIRSLGSVEDMLDARYKMYRWLYYHQKVNLLDRILNKLMINLLEDKLIEPKLLHYKNFVINETLYLDDWFIIDNLRQAYGENPDRYYLLRGIYNQEYLPLPIWSTFEEYVAKIRSVLGDKDPYFIAKRISMLFRDNRVMEALRDVLRDSVHEDIDLISVTKEPTTPYDWRGSEEILFYVPPNRVIKMSEISLYIQKLVEMSKKYTHFYLYYYVPNVKRRNLIRVRSRVEDLFLNHVKDSFPDINQR